MKRSVTFRPRARRDVLEQMVYLGQQADLGTRVAQRYHSAVLTTCGLLADRPLSGRIFATEIPRLQGLRRFRVSRPFERYLIFYKPTSVGIDVARVIHGARDIETVLAEKEPKE